MRMRRSAAIVVVMAVVVLGWSGVGHAASGTGGQPGRPGVVTDAEGQQPAVSPDAAGSAVLPYGDAPNDGSLLGTNLTEPIVDMVSPDAGGYWLVASDGGVFAFGDAGYYGSMGGKALAAPVVGMASTPDGKGYWLVASDGGIFSFGDAAFYGSAGAIHLTRPVVGMAAAPTGGYWLVASDGGIFSYGAPFRGSAGALPLTQPVVGMAADPATDGYWLVASDGGIFSYGATFHGSTGNIALTRPVTAMAADGDGGYWLAASDGGVFAFGTAPFLGSAGGSPVTQPVVGMAATANDGGYWLAEGQKGPNSPFTPALVSAVQARGTSVSATIEDLNSGQIYEYAPGTVGVTASIMKAQILATALSQRQNVGGLTAGEQAVAVPMIEESDNDSASDLYADVGGAGPVTAFDRSIGMDQTYPNAAWGLTTTTTDDQVKLLDHLAVPNGNLNAASQAYQLNLMEHVEPDQAWGVSGGVPGGVTVALKNGWLQPDGAAWQVNSIGIVDGAGRDYLIAVMTYGSPTEAYGIDTISMVAAAAYASLFG